MVENKIGEVSKTLLSGDIVYAVNEYGEHWFLTSCVDVRRYTFICLDGDEGNRYFDPVESLEELQDRLARSFDEYHIYDRGKVKFIIANR